MPFSFVLIKVSDSNAPYFKLGIGTRKCQENICTCSPLTFYLMQFQKMETKLSFLTGVENLVLQSRELTERMRRKLLLERSMLIASRMGAVASRTNQHGQGAPVTRLQPVGYYALNPQLRRP